jgi:hypothetical protein
MQAEMVSIANEAIVNYFAYSAINHLQFLPHSDCEKSLLLHEFPRREMKGTTTEGSKKMYSLFDSQYLWNKVTCSTILARRESESLYVFEATTISG